MNYLRILFACIGIIIYFILPTVLYQESAEATITEIVDSNEHVKHYYFEFFTKDGLRITQQKNRSRSFGPFEKGEKFSLYYNLQRPESWVRKRDYFIFAALFIILMLGFFEMALRFFEKRRG